MIYIYGERRTGCFIMDLSSVTLADRLNKLIIQL